MLVFLKVLWYANKCMMKDFRIHLFSGQKNDFCIKRDGSKFGKIARLQCGEQQNMVIHVFSGSTMESIASLQCKM